MFSRVLKVVSLSVLSLFCLAGEVAAADPAASAEEAGVCKVRLIIGPFAKPNVNFTIVKPTIEALQNAFPRGYFCWEQEPYLDGLIKRARSGEAQQIFVGNPRPHKGGEERRKHLSCMK